MMIRSTQGAAGVVFKGIDPEYTPKVTNLVESLEIGPDGPVSTNEAANGICLLVWPSRKFLKMKRVLSQVSSSEKNWLKSCM